MVETGRVRMTASGSTAPRVKQLSKAKEKAKGTACLSNSRQISFALMMYADDHNDTVVPLEVPGTPPGPRAGVRRCPVRGPGATLAGPGAVAEWTKATVLKTVDLQGSVGSNPTRSASQLGT